MKYRTDDLRIREIREVSPPEQVHSEFPITEQAAETVFRARQAIHDVLCGRDDRLVVIVGPCSIHDPQAARDYGRRLLRLRRELAGELEIVMRVYFEKPRTTVGWKGLINDPHLDESFHINEGLRRARRLLLDVAGRGLPAGCEFLDPITPQFIADLVSWGAIGARTSESQVHRELASGLSMPVGIKNATHGSAQVAIDAMGSALHPHHFLSVTKQGVAAIVSTTGNEDTHIILRGGASGPNYDEQSIREVCGALEKAGLPQRVMVDCSHGNSRKNHEEQPAVAADLARQVAAGSRPLFGMMLESFLVDGRQDYQPGETVRGRSITDACMGWERTEPLFAQMATAVEKRRASS